MRYIIALGFLLLAQRPLAQSVAQLDGRWAFTGLRTTVLKYEKEKLYIGMLDYTDTVNFSRFLRMEPLDSSVFSLANVAIVNDTIVIETRFRKIDHNLRLLYSLRDSNHLLYTGDVFFDSASLIVPNRNCGTGLRLCSNRLYNKQDLGLILQLKNSDAFNRDDAFEFLLRLNEKFKSTCNRCYAGFTDAYMNEILIQMGFNPITRRVSTRSISFNTSGFTFFLKMKFREDKRILQMTDYVFDWYLQR